MPVATRFPISLSSFLKCRLEDNVYSPDLVELQYKFETVPVFIYGTEKGKFQDHLILRDSKLVGYGFTTNPTFLMYKHKKEGQPVVLSSPADPRSARVQGEVWSMKVENLPNLDGWFQNGFFHTRRKRVIQYFSKAVKDKKDKQFFVTDCFMYEATPRVREMDNAYLELQPVIDLPESKPYYSWRKCDDDAVLKGSS
jgi:hypothetical protein